VISVVVYQTIQEWHGSGVGRREIARRLKIDVKTVRRHLRKIEAGILAPKRSSPVSKLDPFSERITELAASGRTAWNVYVALRDDPSADNRRRLRARCCRPERRCRCASINTSRDRAVALVGARRFAQSNSPLVHRKPVECGVRLNVSEVTYA
jgi:hypothetical protein